MNERLISSREDFPSVAVYQRDEPAGRVYRIAFVQREFAEKGTARGAWRALAVMAAVFASMAGCTISFQAGESFGWGWGWTGIGLTVIGFVAVWEWAFGASKVERAIELDLGNDKLRGLRNNRIEVERALSRMANLTVENHPNAEYKRTVRQQKRQEGLSEEEKTHCLFGWFGVGGAERVVLLCRAEWPCQYTLSEVREAIYWALEQAAAGRLAEESMPDTTPVRRAQPHGGGLKPPLD